MIAPDRVSKASLVGRYMDVFNDKQLIAQTYGFFYSRKQEPRQSEKHHPNDTAGGPGERGGVRGLSGPVECVASPLGCAWPHGGGTRGLSGSGVRGPTQREGTWHLGWGARGNTGCGARGNPGPV